MNTPIPTTLSEYAHLLYETLNTKIGFRLSFKEFFSVSDEKNRENISASAVEAVVYTFHKKIGSNTISKEEIALVFNLTVRYVYMICQEYRIQTGLDTTYYFLFKETIKDIEPVLLQNFEEKTEIQVSTVAIIRKKKIRMQRIKKNQKELLATKDDTSLITLRDIHTEPLTYKDFIKILFLLLHERYTYNEEDIKNSGKEEFATSRRVIVYMVKRYFPFVSFVKIGEILGNRNHTTMSILIPRHSADMSNPQRNERGQRYVSLYQTIDTRLQELLAEDVAATI